MLRPGGRAVILDTTTDRWYRAAIPMFNPEFRDNTYGKGLLTRMASFATGRNSISQRAKPAHGSLSSRPWMLKASSSSASTAICSSPKKSRDPDLAWELRVVFKKRLLAA